MSYTGYIFGGAMLFGLWEGWDTLQSAYFCFVTLSTIGFGDVVPGTDFDNPQASAQLILGAIYVLFGKCYCQLISSLTQVYSTLLQVTAFSHISP